MRPRTGAAVIRNGRVYARVGWTEDGKRRQMWRAAQSREHAMQLCAEMLLLLPPPPTLAARTDDPGGFQSYAKCHVYFIQMCDGEINPIKIGIATSPRLRLQNLSTSSPYDLRLLFSYEVESGPLEESRLHKQFKHLRMRGEWFRSETDLIDYINELKTEAEKHLYSRRCA